VEDAILVALNKAPADRFATAKQFAEALGGAGTGMTSRFTKTRAAAVRRRKRRLSAIALSGALGAVALGATWLVFSRGATDARAGSDDFDARRVAVTYFQDDSRGGELAYVADALTEALIERLDEIDALDVISRNGVERFRSGSVPVDRVAAELRAGTLVRGNIEAEGEGIRVTVRLVDGNSGADYGRAVFTQPGTNLLVAGDSLARQVERFLREHVGEEIRLTRERAESSHPEAWLLAQRAERARKDALALMAADSVAAGTERFARADSLLSRAETLDPGWARPIVARAELAFDELLTVRERRRANEVIARGVAHAERALAKEPRNAAALESRGTLRYYRQVMGLATDPAEAADLVRLAEADLKQATSIESDRSSAWATLSLLLYRRYDAADAKLAAQRAYEADAYLRAAPEILYRLYATSWDLEQFEAAAEWCERGRHRYPEQWPFMRCQLWLLSSHVRSPNPEEAWRLVASLAEHAPAGRRESLRREAEMIAALTIDRAGQADSARRVIERARAGPDIDPHLELVGHEMVVRAILGDIDEALELLRMYLTANPGHREGFMRANRWEFRRLRDDPRFLAIVGSGG
jgi:serine/threonine-protein kinase